MSKKLPKKKAIVNVLIAQIFPSSDPIAVDILRLMCGCSDIFHIMKWHWGTTQIPTEPAAQHIASGRTALQFRLLFSYLHESLKVIEHLTGLPGFKDLSPSLDRAATDALAELKKIKLKGEGFTSDDWGVDEAIRRARHTATFHYDLQQTADTLESWLRKHGPNEKGCIILELTSDRGGVFPYYGIADAIRADIAFGIENAQGKTNLRAANALLRYLSSFVQELFFAYVHQRQLSDYVWREELTL